jgi:hypothetical protein
VNGPSGRLVGVLWRIASSGAAADFDFDGDGKSDVAVFRPSNGF